MPESNRLRALPGVEAELFEPPSGEAELLLRRLGWLVSPRELPGSLPSRLLRAFLVAPFTQLTFFSFELQAFLFGVFHTTFWARAGHLIFMCAVNLFTLIGLGQIELGAGIDAGVPYAIALASWHVTVALSAGLALWSLCAAALVVTLRLLAQACIAAPDGAAHLCAMHPWLGLWSSAFLIAASHVSEPRLPPRAVAGPRWCRLRDYVLGPPGAPHAPSVRIANGVRVGLFVLWGTLNEWWAAMRLMPYNVLWLMFRVGYAEQVRERVLGHVQRALASDNPALDYVGIGGATMLRPPHERT